MKSCDILVIEDDPSIRGLIQQTLDPLGLKMSFETDGAVGEARAREYLPTVILLDLGLPSMTGLEILERLRPWFEGSILVITAWGDEEKKLRAFELGADDYISKPFSPRELLARVKVGVKHAKGNTRENRTLNVGNVVIDVPDSRVTVAGKDFAVTQTEFRFLTLLAEQAGRLVSQAVLLKEIWGPNHSEDTHYLRILVSRLRKKLAQAGADASIVTELGLGYRLVTA